MHSHVPFSPLQISALPVTTEDKRDLISRYIDAYNAFDVDEMVATLHPDVEFKNVSGEKVTAAATGLDDFREMAERGTQLFATRTQTITNFEEADDGSVTIDVRYEGTLAQDLPGGLEAGETIELDGRSTFEFADDKIARIVDAS